MSLFVIYVYFLCNFFVSHVQGWPPLQATPIATVTLTLRSLRTRKGENNVVDHCHSSFPPHSPSRSLKQDSEACGGG